MTTNSSIGNRLINRMRYGKIIACVLITRPKYDFLILRIKRVLS